MFEILPPLWTRGSIFAMREYLTGSVTSVFFTLRINGAIRHFHSYCDLSDRSAVEHLLLMQKAGLEADIARLERLRAAHDDDQHAVRRQVRDAERDIDVSQRRITEIGEDIERLVSTAGDAFTMTVAREVHDDRKIAGRALMKEILTLVQLQHVGEFHLATIGGFDLVYDGERFGRNDGYYYTTVLQRTGADYEVNLAVTVTPLGAISRLEHALDGFQEERDRYRHRLEEARRRLVSYRSREGGSFAFSDELAEKRQTLAEVEDALTKSARDDTEPHEVAA